MLSDALVGIYKRGLTPAWRSSQVSTSPRLEGGEPHLAARQVKVRSLLTPTPLCTAACGRGAHSSRLRYQGSPLPLLNF